MAYSFFFSVLCIFKQVVNNNEKKSTYGIELVWGVGGTRYKSILLGFIFVPYSISPSLCVKRTRNDEKEARNYILYYLIYYKREQTRISFNPKGGALVSLD